MNEFIQHNQIYDVKKAVWLYNQDSIKESLCDKCSNANDVKKEIAKLNKFLLNIVWNDGSIDVTYRRRLNYGRFFSNGIQTISRTVREFLLHDKDVLDIDMKNCHPSILRYIVKFYKLGIETPYVDEYVDHRDKIIETQFKHKSKEEAKHEILVATNCDELETQNLWLKAYRADVCNIRQKLKGLEVLKPLWKNCQNKKNKDGSFLNHVLCKWEEIIISDVIKFLVKNNYKIFSYMFDGVMVYKQSNWKFDIIKLNEYIQEQYKEPTFKFVFKKIVNKKNITCGDVDDTMVDKIMLLNKNYEFVKDKLEKEYHLCKILTGEFMVKINSTWKVFDKKGIMNFLDDRLCYDIDKDSKNEEKLIPCHKYWIHDESKLLYDKIVCEPDNDKVDANCLNIYEHYDIMKYAGKSYTKDTRGLEMFEQLISVTCGHEENTKQFFTKWLAHQFQYPGEKTGVCPIISGEQGTGKDTIVETIKPIMGIIKVFTSEQPENQVWGRFNHMIGNCKLIHISEIDGRQTHSYLNRIKGLLTNPKIVVKAEGEKPYTITSYHNYIILTNCNCPVEIQKGNRRFILMRTSDDLKGNQEWFNEYYAKIYDKDFMLTIYDYLMNVQNVPKKFTESDIIEGASNLHQDIENDEELELSFIKSFVANNYNEDIPVLSIKSSELFTYFNEYRKTNHCDRYDYSMKKFTTTLKVYNTSCLKDCVTYKRSALSRGFVINMRHIWNMIKDEEKLNM